jgi:hypothetical protein
VVSSGEIIVTIPDIPTVRTLTVTAGDGTRVTTTTTIAPRKRRGAPELKRRAAALGSDELLPRELLNAVHREDMQPQTLIVPRCPVLHGSGMTM